MPLSINVGLSRKASKDYQSTGYSINVTAELDQSLLARPDELQQQIDALYDHAHQALAKQASPQQPPRQASHQRDRSNGYRPRNNGYAQGNGSRQNGGGMTESQGKAIYAISKRLNLDAGYECKEVFGWDFDHLTIKQASELIDHLKNLQPQDQGRNGGGQ